MLLGGTLLEERLLVCPVEVALEHDGPPGDAAQSALGDDEIVFREAQLRVARSREHDLVRVADRYLAAGCLEDGSLGLRHGDSVASLGFDAQERAEPGDRRPAVPGR